MNQPKPRQIRLPFSVPKPGRTKGQQRTCGVCRRTEGKYTCPRCNLVYCSLACFRDETHAQCSEPFYKSTVMDQIAADPKAGLDEKKGMIEMLRRFEQQAGGEGGQPGDPSDLDPNEEEEEEDELERRLRDVDLEGIDSNKLFHLLPQEHRDAFLATIRDPDSEAGRELLDTLNGDLDKDEEPILPTALPWWESPEVQDDSESDTEEVEYAEAPGPIPIELLTGVTPPEGMGLKLVYNALALCVAYLHTLLAFRSPSLDDYYLKDANLSFAEVKAELGRLAPFLADQKSTIRYTTAREAYSSVWERIGADDATSPSTETLIRLLASLTPLTHPPITTDPPRIHLILADLYHAFAKTKLGPTAKKLLFYLAALQQLDRQAWLSIERELRKEIERLQSELGNIESDEDKSPERPHLLL